MYRRLIMALVVSTTLCTQVFAGEIEKARVFQFLDEQVKAYNINQGSDRTRMTIPTVQRVGIQAFALSRTFPSGTEQMEGHVSPQMVKAALDEVSQYTAEYGKEKLGAADLVEGQNRFNLHPAFATLRDMMVTNAQVIRQLEGAKRPEVGW